MIRLMKEISALKFEHTESTVKLNTDQQKDDYKIHPGYLWSNDIDLESKTNIDDRKYDIIKSMLQENLNHARHVENERITYHGFYAAIVAGSLAFMATSMEKINTGNVLISIALCIILILLGLMTLQLCERWTNAFERHMEYAKGCYYILHKKIFGIDHSLEIDNTESKEKFELQRDPIGAKCKQPLRLDCLPLYCFRIKNPDAAYIIKSNDSRTKVLFRAFDMAVLMSLQFTLSVLIGVVIYKIFTENTIKFIDDNIYLKYIIPIFVSVCVYFGSRLICRKIELILVHRYDEEK